MSILRFLLLALTPLVVLSWALVTRSSSSVEGRSVRPFAAQSESRSILDLAFFTTMQLADSGSVMRCPQIVVGLHLRSGERVAGESAGGSTLADLRSSPDLRLIVGGFGNRFLGAGFDDPSKSTLDEGGLAGASLEDEHFGSIYIMRRLGEGDDSWEIATTVLGPKFLGGIEIMPDEDTLFVATAGVDERPVPGRIPPFRVEMYRLSEMSKIPDSPTRQGTHTLGMSHGAIELPAPAVAIILDQNARLAHILTRSSSGRADPVEPAEFMLITIDVATMTESAERIILPDWIGTAFGPDTPMTALAPDGRHLVTTLGTTPSIAVVDLNERRAWAIRVEDAIDVMDVAFNHNATNHGLLAMNIRRVGAAGDPTLEPWATSQSQVRVSEFYGDRIVEVSRGPFYSGNMEGFLLSLSGREMAKQSWPVLIIESRQFPVWKPAS